MMSMGMCVNGVLTQSPLCVKCSQTDFPLVNRANSMSCRRYKILYDNKRMEVFKCDPGNVGNEGDHPLLSALHILRFSSR